jgi:hypothetical protein
MRQQVAMKDNLKIAEGLTRNSLDWLIKPVISIDEYESKISDERVIVLAFFIGERQPADDLSHFIDRSNIPVLDTEVSPAPTTDGEYVTFVELLRDETFPKNVMALLQEITNLTNVSNWQFVSPAEETPTDISLEQLQENILLDPEELAMRGDATSEISEFWRFANADKIAVDGQTVSLYHNGAPTTIVVKEINNVKPTPIYADDGRARWLQNCLGPSYAVYATENGFLIEHQEKTIFATVVD